MASLGKGVAARVVSAQQKGALACIAQGPSILVVVDDDPSMMAEFFRRNDIRVRTGVEDVTRHLSAKDVNLIMLDLRLGREDGLDVLREIRSRSDIPVIITSGSRRAVASRLLLRSGAATVGSAGSQTGS
jgi:DNA-binding response OmpR family regulator